MASRRPDRQPVPPYRTRLRELFLRPDRFSYADFTDRLADVFGDRLLFKLDRPITLPTADPMRVTYREASRLSSRVANVLREIGVGRGERVVMITLNRVEMLFCNFGAAKMGAISVPLNFMLTADEVDYAVRNCGAETLICDRTVFDRSIRDTSRLPTVKTWVMIDDEAPPEPFHGLGALVASASDRFEPVRVAEDDVVIIFYTSGTSGHPKGAALSNRSAMVPVRRYVRWTGALPAPRRQLALLVMPVAHSGGYVQVLVQYAIGIPMFFMSRFSPRAVLETIERERATFFSGTPTMYRMLLEAGARDHDLSSIRVWGGGADAFSDDLVREMREVAARRVTGVKVRPLFIRGYGMAEANSWVSMTPPIPAGSNCAGWVLPGMEYRIVGEDGAPVPRGEVGELELRGDALMREYWNDPARTAEALRPGGWFRTGDLVRQGRYRLLYFVDREKDVIKSGGYTVGSGEIERVLEAHPAVERAAAVGLPDPIKGQRPVAAVVLKRTVRASPDELRRWAAERLAAYKCPREVVILDEIPLTFSLKPMKREVRRLLEERLGGPGGAAERPPGAARRRPPGGEGRSNHLSR